MNMVENFRKSLAWTLFALILTGLAAYRLVWEDLGPVGFWSNVIQIMLGAGMLTLVALGKLRREPPDSRVDR